jgi:hypothetical protein
MRRFFLTGDRWSPYNHLSVKRIRHISLLLTVLALVLPVTLQPVQAGSRPGCCSGKQEAPCSGDDLSAAPPACCRSTPTAPPEPAQRVPSRIDSQVADIAACRPATLFCHPPRRLTRPGTMGSHPVDSGAPPLFTLHASYLI